MRVFPGDKEMAKISSPEYDIDADMCLVVEFGCIDCDLKFAFKVSPLIHIHVVFQVHYLNTNLESRVTLYTAGQLAHSPAT